MATITTTIKSEGKEMSPEFELLSIDTTKVFNKVPTAELRLKDGDVASGKYKILDGGFFEPGKKVDIALKYESKAKDGGTIFAGVVVSHALELNKKGPTLTVELADMAVKMASARQNAVYSDKSDGKIIQELIGQHGLAEGPIGAGSPKHAQMIQCYTTDWDFMLSRAEANGLLVVVDDGKVSAIVPKVADKADLALALGKDEIYDLDLQANGRGQYGTVSSVGLAIGGRQLTEPTEGKDFPLKQGSYRAADMATAAGADHATLVHPVPMPDAERKAWSDAQLLKSRLALLRGWVKIPGTTKITVGQTIEIKGVGSHFGGRNIVSGVRQEATTDGWATHIQIGMDACWFTSQPNVTDAPAAGLLPGVNGLQIGIVQSHQDDPLGQYRANVIIPAFDKENTLWARLASIDAGPERGLFFRPEKGDEVVVGFLNDDPRQAIILGAVHSSPTNKAPWQPKAQNGQKGIMTKSKYQLLFDEEKETVTLSTPQQNKIEIDEKNGRVSMQDANGNLVALGKEGVVVNSAKDMKIDIKGDLAIKASGNVAIAGQKVDLI